MKREINFLSNDIKNLVLNKLENKENLFMLRMGDGEMRIEKNHTSIEKFSIKEFGRKLTKNELEVAKEWMRESVLESTILGLPTLEHCETNELWEYLFKYYDEIQEKNKDVWKKKEYCSINSHYELLGTGDLFEILSKVKKIVIVSPRDIQSRLIERFNNIEIIEYYSLPGEQAYEPEESKNRDIDIFTRISEIIDNFKLKDRNGELLIFGAGPLGKILGCEFSKQGGVSLDLGSVFDLFVGKITRGKGKGPNSKIKPIL